MMNSDGTDSSDQYTDLITQGIRVGPIPVYSAWADVFVERWQPLLNLSEIKSANLLYGLLLW
jgi:hypothetical protein